MGKYNTNIYNVNFFLIFYAKKNLPKLAFGRFLIIISFTFLVSYNHYLHKTANHARLDNF
jgi:hypothetical protein